MWRLSLIVFCALSLYTVQGYGGGHSDSLTCIRKNEEAACVKACPPERTCRNRGILFSCLDDGSKCVDKCVCKAGYFRNPLGDCISGEECDRCPGNHEYFACGPACDNVCADLHKQNRTNCPIVNIKCNDMCYCEDGFARDDKKECVPVENCPKSPHGPEAEQTCGLNEEWTTCKRTCPPESCFSLVARFKCVANEPCKPRCTCKPGFLRLEGGAPCMPQCQCPELVNSPDCNKMPNICKTD